FFFFQAEDGIRDFHVTGVQTCALPISDHADAAGIGGDVTADGAGAARAEVHRVLQSVSARSLPYGLQHGAGLHRECAINWIEARSEERRVGKECRSRWSA